MSPENSSSKPLVVCADDFSLNAEVSAGILDLLATRRLSAVGCMTQSPLWREWARQLRDYSGKADIGLHLNFTQSFDGDFASQIFTRPLAVLMGMSVLRVLSKKRLRASICQQLDNFEQEMGAAPDFIDGHQHVHVFPQIRDCLLEECARRYGNKPAADKPWIRSVATMYGDGGLKGKVVQWMGAQACESKFRGTGFAHNTAFAGLYNLKPDAPFDKQMRTWLNALPAGGLIMCHPARAFVEGDAHPAARVAEYHYFMGNQWMRALADAGVYLVRGSDLFNGVVTPVP